MKPHGPLVRSLALGFFLAALAVAAHLTWTHESLLRCGGQSSCLGILRSRWSLFLGVPVSLLGVLAYGLLVVTGAIGLGSRAAAPAVRHVETAGFVLALGAAAWFVAVQAFLVGSFCPWCTAAHGLASGGVLLAWTARPKGPASSKWAFGLPLAAVAGLALVQTFGPEPERTRSAVVSGLLATSPDAGGRLRLYGGEIVIDPEALPAIGGRASVAGLVLTDWTCPFCLELHRTLEDVAAEAGPGVGFVVAPGFRTAEARELHRVMLALWRTDPERYDETARAILAGEIDASPAAVSAPAEAPEHAAWIDEILRTSERLLHENDARLDVASLPQLMIGERLLVGLPRRETILGLVRAFAGVTTPPSERTMPVVSGLADEDGGLTFVERSLDLGQVVRGETATGRFEFLNDGAKPVSITKITSTCACATARGWRQTVEPGAAGGFEVRLDSSRLKGKIRKSIEVETSGTSVATRLAVLVDVWSPVKMTPSAVSFGSGKKGTKVQPKRVRIEVTDPNPLEIADVRTTNPRFRAQLETIVPGRRYEVALELPGGIDGTHRGELVIALNHPRIAEERLALTVSELQMVRVYPEEIVGSATPSPQPTKSAVTVHVDDPRFPELTISDPRFVGDSEVRLELQETENARSRRIVIAFPAGFDAVAAEAAGAHLAFATNHPDFPEIRVPIRVAESQRRDRE